MLVGCADPEALAAGAPTMSTFDTAATELRGVDVFQLLCEIKSGREREMLPPALLRMKFTLSTPIDSQSFAARVMRSGSPMQTPSGIAAPSLGLLSLFVFALEEGARFPRD